MDSLTSIFKLSCPSQISASPPSMHLSLNLITHVRLYLRTTLLCPDSVPPSCSPSHRTPHHSCTGPGHLPRQPGAGVRHASHGRLQGRLHPLLDPGKEGGAVSNSMAARARALEGRSVCLHSGTAAIYTRVYPTYSYHMHQQTFIRSVCSLVPLSNLRLWWCVGIPVCISRTTSTNKPCDPLLHPPPHHSGQGPPGGLPVLPPRLHHPEPLNGPLGLPAGARHQQQQLGRLCGGNKDAGAKDAGAASSRRWGGTREAKILMWGLFPHTMD